MQDTTKSGGDVHPYAQGALIYYRKGWQNVFPVGRKGGPQYAKEPVPKGVTGYEAPGIPFEKIYATVHGAAGLRNLAIRMPRTVICLDVDQYEDHDGMDTLRKMEADLGELPPTFRNSARGFQESGHRYFRCPLNFITRPGAEEIIEREYGPNIEVLHYGRRYALAWPSLNPAAGLAPYLWYSPDGTPLPEPPAVWNLPTLPERWAELLTAPIGSPEAVARSLRGPRAEPVAGADEDLFEVARQLWRRSVAERLAVQQFERVLKMKVGEVNKVLGGAGIVFARLAEAGLFTPSQAMEALVAAVRRNGVHSDTWNVANRKGWTLQSRLDDAFSQGLAKPPVALIDDHAPTDLHAYFMREVGR